MPPGPLADRMRPRTLEEILGQEHLLGAGQPLRVQLERDDFGSMILWGPPGVGKTTLAEVIAARSRAQFVPFSAVTSGIKEIREVMAAAARAARGGGRTLLFVDEIHRFNKAQQDAFLPYLERGALRLIGATTENPSFELNSALLSRVRVYVLQPLSEDQIVALLRRALEDADRGLRLTMPPQAQLAWGNAAAAGPEAAGREQQRRLRQIAVFANGDARAAYNLLESAVAGTAPAGVPPVIRLDEERLRQAMQRRVLLYDQAGDEHYNLISALHKSLRNSDADAALYWMARMLEAGEDPLYIARRLVRFASEDIGLADARALEQANAARAAIEFIGLPEGALALAQACIYLALAPKSNALYRAYGQAIADVREQPALPVPLALRNAPTALMRDLGYGREYQYAHDLPEQVADMPCLPDNLAGRRYYRPGGQGEEAELRRRLDELESRRRRARKTED